MMPSGKLSALKLLAMKVALGMTTNQMRAQKRHLVDMYKGFKCDSEKIQKIEIDALFVGCDITTKYIKMWHKEERNPRSIKGMIRKPTPSACIANLTTFTTHLLDEYEKAEKLI